MNFITKSLLVERLRIPTFEALLHLVDNVQFSHIVADRAAKLSAMRLHRLAHGAEAHVRVVVTLFPGTLEAEFAQVYFRLDHGHCLLIELARLNFALQPSDFILSLLLLLCFEHLGPALSAFRFATLDPQLGHDSTALAAPLVVSDTCVPN